MLQSICNVHSCLGLWVLPEGHLYSSDWKIDKFSETFPEWCLSLWCYETWIWRYFLLDCELCSTQASLESRRRTRQFNSAVPAAHPMNLILVTSWSWFRNPKRIDSLYNVANESCIVTLLAKLYKEEPQWREIVCAKCSGWTEMYVCCNLACWGLQPQARQHCEHNITYALNSCPHFAIWNCTVVIQTECL